MSRTPKQLYEFGPFRLDATEHVLLRDGEPVSLTPKAFDTLLALVQNSGHLLGKDQLMKLVWPDAVVEENNLNQNISVLRKVLGEPADEQTYIETVPRRGYRFMAPVKELPGPDAELILERLTRSRVVIEAEEDAHGGTRRDGEAAIAATSPSRRDFAWVVVAIAVLVAGLALSFSRIWTRGQSTPTETPVAVSIAVLPFKPLSADGSDDYLGLGMADTLITKLSNLRQIIVRPTSAVRKYVAPEQDPLAAGREQRVDAVLEGNIQKSGEKIRVTVRMMRVRDGSSLWAYKCDEQCTNIFEMQDAISEKVAASLAMKLTGEEQKRLAKHYTDNPEAYHLYLRGRYFWNKRTEEALKKGIEYFQQAIERDPSFAMAYAGIADCYNSLGNSIYGGLQPREALPKAKSAAMKALEVDEVLAEAHASLGFAITQYDWDWPVAERELRRAIELNPNYPTAHHFYPIQPTACGRLDESLTEIKRAQELDPLSLIIQTDLARRFYFRRQYEEASEQLRKTLDMDPNFFRAHLDLGEVCVQQGKYEEAIAEFRQAIKLSGGSPVAVGGLGHAYAVSGQHAEARKVLGELSDLAKRRYVSPSLSAAIHVALGEKDQAFKYLAAAYEERASSLIRLKVEPNFGGLRSDPRFADLVRRVGLAP